MESMPVLLLQNLVKIKMRIAKIIKCDHCGREVRVALDWNDEFCPDCDWENFLDGVYNNKKTKIR